MAGISSSSLTASSASLFGTGLDAAEVAVNALEWSGNCPPAAGRYIDTSVTSRRSKCAFFHELSLVDEFEDQAVTPIDDNENDNAASVCHLLPSNNPDRSPISWFVRDDLRLVVSSNNPFKTFSYYPRHVILGI